MPRVGQGADATRPATRPVALLDGISGWGNATGNATTTRLVALPHSRQAAAWWLRWRSVSNDWVSTAEAAQELGVSAAAVRKRLRSCGEDLVEAGLARRAAAGDDGGHDRWEVDPSAVRAWAAERDETPAPDAAAEGGRRAEELEMARREVAVLEVELERRQGEVLRERIARLEAENARLGADNARLRDQLATLGNTLRAFTAH